MNLIKTTHFILYTVLFALVGNAAIAEQTSASYRIVNQVLPAGGGYHTFSPDGILYAWAKGDGLITIDLATGKGNLALDSDIPLEGLTMKKNEGNVFFGEVGTDLWEYEGNTDTLDVLCPNALFGETEAL